MSDKEWRFLDKWAELIMVLATIVPPFMTIVFMVDGGVVSIAILALFWAIFPPAAPVSGFQMLNINYFQGTLIFGFFNIVFAFQVIRFIRGKSGKIKTLAAGAMTIVVPLIAFIFAMRYMIMFQYFTYVGPIPIQFVIGLLLMHFVPPEEPTTPW
ncbi:hypothetical protein E4H12_08600 [Candidatus Thorarchaeota archaeon]|nr:MAG: hypothetical protein E4H12_08600 [Candidatus Thorarchaeota archaeon]